MSSAIFQASRFLIHWLREVDEHSLHSPFTYSFHKKIIQRDRHEPEFIAIEEIRKKLQLDERTIEVTDLGAGSRVNKGSQKKVKRIAEYEISKPRFSRLWYRVARSNKSKNILEIGTSLGINTLYLSQAIENGKLITIEGCPSTAAIAQENFDKLQHCPIELLIGDAAQKIAGITESLDLAYIDANHTYQGTTKYFELLLPKIHSDSIMIFDDIHWSDGMEKAWNEVRKHPSVRLSLDLFSAGILFFKEGLPREHFRIQY